MPARAFRAATSSAGELQEQRARMVARRRVSLPFEQADGVLCGCSGLAGAAGEAKNLRPVDEHLRMLAQSVGRRGDFHGLLRQHVGLVERSVSGEALRAKRAPRELRARVVRGRTRFGDFGPRLALVESTLPIERLAQPGRLGPQPRTLAGCLELLTTPAKEALGITVVAGEQLDVSSDRGAVRRDLVGPGELFVNRLSARHELTSGVEPSGHRFEPCLEDENVRLPTTIGALEQRPAAADPCGDGDGPEVEAGRAFGSPEEPEERQLQARAELSPAVLLRERGLERVAEDLLDVVEFATKPEHGSKLAQEVTPDDLLRVQERRGTREEVCGRGRVAALRGAKAGRGEVVTGISGEAACARLVRAELREIEMRLFQMEADQFVRPRGLILRPEREPLVEL